ncbi:MAG: amidohydrolase family protein, partial [Eubacteriales bacterium]|nr:amidohydrolase family protein [Eubacteriales bacterium]
RTGGGVGAFGLDFIDTHAHIYPDAIAMKAAQSIGDFYHLPVKADGRLSTLLGRGREAGITRHLVHSVGITPERVAGINDYLMATVAQYPSRLIGFGTMHPALPDVRAELRRIKAGGLRGVKLHPDFQHFCLDDEKAMEMFRALAEMNLPVLVHTGDSRYPYSEPNRMARVLKAVPELKAICAHLGGWSVWNEAWKALADLPNVWVDTSSSLYALPPDEAVAIIRRYGMDRVFFGTDFPMWDPVEERARFDALPLTDAEYENIAHRNFEAFMKELDSGV